MKHIQSTSHAFAALLENGEVVTWGRLSSGGDSTSDVTCVFVGTKVSHDVCAEGQLLGDVDVIDKSPKPDLIRFEMIFCCKFGDEKNTTDEEIL